MKTDMTIGKEWKIILLFTLPIVAENLLQQLYGAVDGIIVGNFVGEYALAAVVTTQSLFFFFLSMAIGLSVGVGIVVSQYFGAGKNDEIPEAIDTALILLGFCGILLTIIALATTPFLLRVLIGVPENILQESIAYFRIVSLGLFFQFVYNGIAAILRSVGDSKATLYFLIIATLLNMGLNLLFVTVFPWGLVGVAAGTGIAQAVCMIVSYIYMRRKFPFVRSGVHWNHRIASTMVKLGFPIAIQFGIVSIGHAAMQRLVNSFSVTVPGIIAAFGAANRIDMFIFAPIMSFQSGLASFTGQNIGADRLDRVKRGFNATLVMSLSITIVFSVVMFLFAAPLVALFGLDGEAQRIGAEQIRFFSLIMWLFSGYITLGGLLQGAGDTIIQSSATIAALAVRIAGAYIVVHFGWLGYTAAWVTTPFGWVVATVIIYARYFTGGWKKKKIVSHAGDRTIGEDDG